MNGVDALLDTEWDAIQVAYNDHVLCVTLGRGEASDATAGGPRLGADLYDELRQVFLAAVTLDQVRVVVLRGHAGSFASGWNLRQLAADEYDRSPMAQLFHFDKVRLALEALLHVPQPTIASVGGPAVGGAATLALHCDIVLMSERARLGDPHVKRGFVAAGQYIWPTVVGMNIAKEYLLTGDLMAADEAHRLGIANHVYPEDVLDAETRKLSAKLAHDVAPKAVQWTKKLLNKTAIVAYNDQMYEGLALEALTVGTDDFLEGLRAFLERRKPAFTGK
jgi:enoyl-CoA hydratase